ncbi:MAG TPA: Panacea domain-containing protein [bacterium]|nr:Panacea domain-containing protein [bacterium]HPN42501.1 Panacea domain-containing protein [bacterium]
MAEHNLIYNKNLDEITSSIVFLTDEIGVYHYNKLTYLFEYFFIKNFGFRYTKEKFLKYPHGPVISNYKNQIHRLYKNGIINVNCDELNKKRTVDDYLYKKIIISKTDLTISNIITNSEIFNFIEMIIEKFARLTTDELENIIYQTTPIKNYLTLQENNYRKKIGGYIFPDCIRLKDYKDIVVKGRELALKHSLKYPQIDIELHKDLAIELAYMSNLRPKLCAF